MNESTFNTIGITEWFAGKSIFITGATGFMGKVLVEKLLRDCPDVDRLYLLIRSKKGVDPEQRREEYINHMVFDNVRNINPKQLDKIRPVKGDVSIDGLGLNDQDRQELINTINVVFHCAANVRFDQPLKDAVNMNTLGTYRILQLAEYMNKLKVFVHVSTTYCQCNEDILEERAYRAPNDPFGIIKMTQTLDDSVLEYITPKLLKGLPNTYAYTKALTEDLVNSFDGKIPLIVTRPSIVTAAVATPYPGWVEGLNGPTGMIIGAARGVIRTMHCNPHYPADVIPVDVAINAIIAAAWTRGTNDLMKIEFCNVTVDHERTLTWGECVEKGREFFYETPLAYSLWYPGGSIKANYWYHSLCVLLFHYIPAYFLDALLILLRKKPFMIRVQRKVSQGLDVLQYYTTKIWIFKTDNLKRLRSKLSKKDLEKFDFNTEHVDWDLYIKNYILGARHFLLKEKPESIPRCKKLLRRLYILDLITTGLFYAFLIWLAYSYFGVVFRVFESLFDYSVKFVKPKING